MLTLIWAQDLKFPQASLRAPLVEIPVAAKQLFGAWNQPYPILCWESFRRQRMVFLFLPANKQQIRIKRPPIDRKKS
jgi:hypothetical protein